MVDEPKTIEDYKGIFETHMELCKKLHGMWDEDLPTRVEEEIYDLVYRHFEP
jgi:hypothetical protein